MSADSAADYQEDSDYSYNNRNGKLLNYATEHFFFHKLQYHMTNYIK